MKTVTQLILVAVAASAASAPLAAMVLLDPAAPPPALDRAEDDPARRLVCTAADGCAWRDLRCGGDADCVERYHAADGRPLRVVGYGCGPDRVTAYAPEEDELPGPRCDAVEALDDLGLAED